MILSMKVVFIYLILLISPKVQKVETFNMPGDKSKVLDTQVSVNLTSSPIKLQMFRSV